jgi:hypothetical protein
VFVGVRHRLSVFDVRSGAVRPFAEVDRAFQLALSEEGRLYAARSDALSAVDVAPGNPLALDPVDKRVWRQAWGIAVLGDFFCIADGEGHCVHVIPRV